MTRLERLAQFEARAQARLRDGPNPVAIPEGLLGETVSPLRVSGEVSTDAPLVSA